ncbi:hypothetical protein F4V43_17740 [Paenibacillus spiritus]|uniref:DUF5412 domain-containing protein n=1 Tax=Paenibacillus spiritus TaxID=2496557 RepID=A0A5J5FUZ2_9BACL|nr:DUF5412 family protein [Paenibacillus spiritus]KAA8997138.1 hypothetical protein F4V43_17740 [Paenibacillus spiritus]
MRLWNGLSFAGVLVLYILTGYAVYTNLHGEWDILPPVYVILLVSVFALLSALAGFRDRSSRFSRMRSRISTVLSLISTLVLLAALLFTNMFSGSKERITASQSPDRTYTLEFYRTDAGAMGSFGIVGELDGPLWFTKRVYTEKRAEQVQVKWENDHTVIINTHKLNLDVGEVWNP